MGIIQAFFNWREGKYQEHLEAMYEEDKCPQCHGKGYHVYPPVGEFIPYNHIFDCAGCEGSGSYSKWDSSIV
ncbi:methionine aminopeptidase [Robertmurraya sp. GLU-23]